MRPCVGFIKPLVRWQAAVLGVMDSEVAAAVLTRMLEHPSQDVSQAGGGGGEGVARLVATMDAHHAARTLRHLPQRAREALLADLPDSVASRLATEMTMELSAEALRGMGPGKVAALVEKLALRSPESGAAMLCNVGGSCTLAMAGLQRVGPRDALARHLQHWNTPLDENTPLASPWARPDAASK